MHGVESVIGAYLAIMLIISVMLGFYALFNNSSANINDQLNNSMEKMLYLNNPPVLSLSYINESFIKLTIYPYIPLYVKEILVKDINGTILEYKPLNISIMNSFDVEISRPRRPAILVIVSRNGIVYYYAPRSDPNLASAPEEIRSKIYIDDELINYLSSGNSNNEGSGNSGVGNVLVLHSVGYKITIGRVPGDKFNDVFSRGPVPCLPYFPDVYSCNINAYTLQSPYYYVTFLTYNYSASNWQVSSDGTLYLNLYGLSSLISSGYPFFQVLKFARIKSENPVQIYFNYSAFFTMMYGSDPGNTWVNVVLYVLPPYFELENAIFLAPPTISGRSATGWLYRALLVQFPPYSLPRDSSKATYGPATGNLTLTVNPLDYGYSEVLVAVGFEIITTGGRLYANICVQ